MIYYLDDVRKLYNLPLTSLVYYAQEVHQQAQVPNTVQLNMLQSIKTGACPEDCAYCPQSSRHSSCKPEPLMATEKIVEAARKAKAAGAGRFCMGAAWRKPVDGPQFESVLETVRQVKALGLQVCCTLGLLTLDQAKRLKDAGCDIYNHNLDTSREFYPEIITTRTYDDRLETIRNVQEAGMGVCSGGILGMGETLDDRLKMLCELANMETAPESIPINALIPCPGTPLEGRPPVDVIEFVRIVAVARIIVPKAIIRISAGRANMSEEAQALCFCAGANSIFLGERLLTRENSGIDKDYLMLKKFGLSPLDPLEHKKKMSGCKGDGTCEVCTCGGEHPHDHHHDHVPAESVPVESVPAPEENPSELDPALVKGHENEMDENGTWGRACNGDHHH